jgi:hypothetical protein
VVLLKKIGKIELLFERLLSKRNPRFLLLESLNYDGKKIGCKKVLSLKLTGNLKMVDFGV